MKNIRFPWWASPSTLLVISLLVVFYAIVFVDDEQYNIWKTPRYVTHVEAVEVGSVIVAVLLGIVVAASKANATTKTTWQTPRSSSKAAS